MVSERQQKILESVILEYVNSAEPVSSQTLEKKYDLNVSSATIRSEMKELANKKLLSQPHTSAGRIPTDKGYGFFVDKFLREEFADEDEFEIEKWIGGEMDSFRLISLMTKKISSICCTLSLGYLPENNILWKEGWEEILKEPEFEKSEYISVFADFLKDIECKISKMESESDIKVYIGKNPFSKLSEFSIISSGCFLPKKKKGILAIIGPKRMDYNRNLNLMNSVLRALNDY
jgi:transcriptional regulator of heat shock response